ncbi:anthranilate synthase component I family protein [Paenibacillus doosanensis]|uniref:anthranilate synthase component I family protein n=1 Tax=Paenibacillus doosanensis TaxID=1229154 RepID=UPI00218038DF|nr:anthranilate synthase component I family protein [Paenibacillus doosanensis]MCS7463179.1 anthranilate synthase component I family protein [Paenibacillus doosanensis]
MTLITYDQWQQWADRYTVLPYVQSYPLEDDRCVSWEAAWEQASPGSFVLESGKGGRYTFLGLHPSSAIRGDAQRAVIRHENGTETQESGRPLDMVKRWMEPYRSPAVRGQGLPKFLGGCVGFWSYDVIRTIEKLPEQAADDLPVPDYAFARFDKVWIIDHKERMLYIAVHTVIGQEQLGLPERYQEAEEQARRMKLQWDRIAAVNDSGLHRQRRQSMLEQIEQDRLQIDVESIEDIRADFPKEAYIKAVERIQRYIGAGDVFQVNLSVRQHKPLSQSPESIYEWLRVVNPSPYMGMLRYEDFQLVSGSPELLVQLEERTMRTRPIAGTRPRGRDAEEDRRLADELIHHEKERAEHIMLVDLERNDLGRIAAYGTVNVKDFMVIEYYSHVMHIVSQVEGQLAAGKQAYDVIAATFPGGTITGAPKIRTMEIIEELEPVRRGPYTGSIGWIDYNGDMEFNIIIRTLVAAGGIGYVQAGAGIVIDSIPEKEYIESINKAKAMWKAIQYSERNDQTLV